MTKLDRGLLAVALTFALGCGEQVYVGQPGASCGGQDPNCSFSFLVLPERPRVAPASSEVRITPTWILPASDIAKQVSASDGGLWLFSGPSAEPFARRVDADGKTLRTVALPKRAASPGQPALYFGATTFSASAHALGPTAVLEWKTFCNATTPDCSLEATKSDGLQVVTVPEDANSAPTALTCPRQDKDCKYTFNAVRSDDGMTTLTSSLESVYARTATGERLWGKHLDDEYAPSTAFVQIGAQSWVAYGYYSAAAGRALISVSEDQGALHYHTQQLLSIDADDQVMAGSVVLRTGALGDYALVARRSTYHPELAPGMTASNASSATLLAGDLTVLRLRGAELVDEQVLLHVDDSQLTIDGAASDSAGNVYIATSSAERDVSTGALSFSSLLCRATPTQRASCFMLPSRATALVAGNPGIVFVRTEPPTGATLSRFDLPSATP